MRDIIIDLEAYDTWKNQLTIAINFVSSKDDQEQSVMHSKNKYIKIKPYNDANEVVEGLFQSLHSTYDDNSETIIRESEFIFDSV